MLKALDVLLGLDSGNLAMLTLLDLSAAFDSVNHNTLLRRLTTSYGLGGLTGLPHTLVFVHNLYAHRRPCHCHHRRLLSVEFRRIQSSGQHLTLP